MIVLDIETTGVSPELDSILSIGAVDMLAPGQRQFYGECRLQTDRQWNKAALDINGFSQEQIFDTKKPTEKELLLEFTAWFRLSINRTIGGLHVESFDVPFLRSAAERNEVSSEFGKRCVDLHTLAYAKMLQLGHEIPIDTQGFSLLKTDEIHIFTGIGSEPRPHNALTGAQYEAESINRIIHGKELLEMFENKPLPEYLL